MLANPEMINQKSFDSLGKSMKRSGPKGKNAVIEHALELMSQISARISSDLLNIDNRFQDHLHNSRHKKSSCPEIDYLIADLNKLVKADRPFCCEIDFLGAIIAYLTDTHPHKKVTQVGLFLEQIGFVPE